MKKKWKDRTFVCPLCNSTFSSYGGYHQHCRQHVLRSGLFKEGKLGRVVVYFYRDRDGELHTVASATVAVKILADLMKRGGVEVVNSADDHVASIVRRCIARMLMRSRGDHVLLSYHRLIGYARRNGIEEMVRVARYSPRRVRDAFHAVITQELGDAILRSERRRGKKWIVYILDREKGLSILRGVVESQPPPGLSVRGSAR